MKVRPTRCSKWFINNQLIFNMFRAYLRPKHLLHLVGLTFIYLWKTRSSEHKICRKDSKLVKIGQNYRVFTWKLRNVLLLPATINWYKSALFEWNGFRQLGQWEEVETLQNFFSLKYKRGRIVAFARQRLTYLTATYVGLQQQGNTLFFFFPWQQCLVQQ
jgi:hypothetical protein